MLRKAVLRLHVSMRADVSTHPTTAAVNEDGCEDCVGRERSRPITQLLVTAVEQSGHCISTSSHVRPNGGARGWLSVLAANRLGASLQRRSTGLRTPSGPRLRTCVYTIVVLRSACPNNSCTVRMSYPSSSRWVANECRNVCGPTRLVIPACRAACATAFWTTDS